MRVCLLTNILPPYRVAFFNELARLCELTVILDAWLTPDRNWSVDPSSVKFNYVIANGWRLRRQHRGVGYDGDERYVELANRTLPLLRRFKPQLVVSAEMGARTLQASVYCKLHDVPLVCFWEGTPRTEQRATKLAKLLRKTLAIRCRGFWVNGAASSEYVRSLGVPASRIFPGMTGVDTTYFRAASLLERTRRDEHRRALGLHGTVFVCSASLKPIKGIGPYLAALTRLRELHPRADFSLLFIGDGELRNDVEAWARAHPDVAVVLTGFVQTDALARLYVCGDWFVLPTLDDCWPLATIEPLICGLPQIYSIHNGATADLMRWPQTGIAVDPLDVNAFAHTLARALPGPTTLPNGVIDEVAAFYAPTAQAERALRSLEAIMQTMSPGAHATALRINA